jgi:hypothetical protein
MFGYTKKLEEKVSTTLYDLTHLEINTIIKEEMIASKSPASPRLILHALASMYHEKLVALGNKYNTLLHFPSPDGENIFRGKMIMMGSGYESFKELSDRAESSVKLLNDYVDRNMPHEEVLHSDVMMLQRIHTISDDVRRILKMEGVDPCRSGTDCDFNDPETIMRFRNLPAKQAEKYELKLDLRQLMVFKKANDIGTERVVLQTVIGMDGDITTRVSRSFAEQPVAMINQMHHEAITISVDFWKNLIQVVVRLGENILGMFNKKS